MYIIYINHNIIEVKKSIECGIVYWISRQSSLVLMVLVKVAGVNISHQHEPLNLCYVCNIMRRTVISC